MIKQEFLDGKIVLYNADCLEVMQEITSESINLVLTDPPYLYLNHKLDKQFDEELFFKLAYQILGDGFILFFGRGKSFYHWNCLCDKIGFDFKEEIIWDKNQQSSPVLVLQRIHETIAVWQKGNVKLNNVYIDAYEYNLQAEKTFEADLKRLIALIKNYKTIEELDEWKEGKYEKIRTNKHNLTSSLKLSKDKGFNIFQMYDRGRRLTSICRVNREHYKFIHPTQKPVKLLSHLINLCSQPNDLVFDGFSGSGSTAIACIKTNRRFIGCELDKDYFDASCKRIEAELKQTNFFN